MSTHGANTDVFIILPAFGTPGVCLDFDEDCAEMDGPRKWALCWMVAPPDERLICPFLD